MLCINASVDEIEIKPKLFEQLKSFQKVSKNLERFEQFENV